MKEQRSKAQVEGLQHLRNKKQLSNFINAIETVRKRKGYSMREVSRRCDVSYGYFNHLLNGYRNIPKPDTIKKIAKGLGVHDSYLFDSAGMNYLSQGKPYIKEQNENGRKVFSYQGKKISEKDMSLIQRILDTM